MSLEKGAVLIKLMKQNLNVRISTEGGFVGSDDMIGYVLWGKYFIKSQRYTVQNNVLFQEKKSTMLLENNGRMSSGKIIKHIKASYLLIVDNIYKWELEIQHCPVDQMWAGVLNKPNQGKAFRFICLHLKNVPK